jgi:hypothetical protein
VNRYQPQTNLQVHSPLYKLYVNKVLKTFIVLIMSLTDGVGPLQIRCPPGLEQLLGLDVIVVEQQYELAESKKNMY